MAASQHDEAQHELAARVPAAGEGVAVVRDADGEADVAVGRDNLHEDVEDGVVDGLLEVVVRLDDHDDEEREDEPPQVVGELAPDLLADEGDAAVVVCVLWRAAGADAVERHCCFEALVEVLPHCCRGARCDPSETGSAVDVGRGEEEVAALANLGVQCRRVVFVDAERSLLVDVGVAHGDGHGEDGDVHHDHIKKLNSGIQARDGYDGEAGRANSC